FSKSERYPPISPIVLAGRGPAIHEKPLVDPRAKPGEDDGRGDSAWAGAALLATATEEVPARGDVAGASQPNGGLWLGHIIRLSDQRVRPLPPRIAPQCGGDSLLTRGLAR